MADNFSFAGFGLGLRPVHYSAIIEQKPNIDWFEAITEDFMVEGGAPIHYLNEIASSYPIVFHGVSLSIGSVDPINQDYLSNLKSLVDRYNPLWVSDHLCWTGLEKINTHALLPLPFTEEVVNHVAEKIMRVQDFLQRRLVLENISTYINFKDNEMTEWECIRAIAEKADCRLLLDLNNVYVNAYNHGFKPNDYLSGLPASRIQQFHLSGHYHCDTHIIDTHDTPVLDPVWSLYEQAVQLFPKTSVLIERDGNIPPLEELVLELDHARSIYEQQSKVPTQ